MSYDPGEPPKNLEYENSWYRKKRIERWLKIKKEVESQLDELYQLYINSYRGRYIQKILKVENKMEEAKISELQAKKCNKFFMKHFYKLLYNYLKRFRNRMIQEYPFKTNLISKEEISGFYSKEHFKNYLINLRMNVKE